jgi:hypothetical protein
MSEEKKVGAVRKSVRPVPTLRAALALIVEHEKGGRIMTPEAIGLSSRDAVARAAKAALELGGKVCFFCGADAPYKKLPLKKTGGVDWAAIELCKCLADVRSDTSFAIPCRYPHELMDLLEKVESGAVKDSETAFSASCRAKKRDAVTKETSVCGTRFNVTAGALARAVRGYLKWQGKEQPTKTEGELLLGFKHQTKCALCREDTRRKLPPDQPQLDGRPKVHPTRRDQRLIDGLGELLKNGGR